MQYNFAFTFHCSENAVPFQTRLAIMSYLLDQIRKINREAADELRSAGFVEDDDIRTLDRQDLLELLPGKDRLRVRKEIHKLICRLSRQNPTHETILKDLKELLQSYLLTDGLTNKETLLECMRAMKAFNDAIIDLLETNRTNPPEKANEVVYNANSVSAFRSARCAPAPETSTTESKTSILSRLNPYSWIPNSLTHQLSQKRQGTSPPTTAFNSANEGASTAQPKLPPLTKAHVMYKMVVSGKTLEKHVDVLDRLNGPVPGHMVSLQLKEAQCEEDSKVTIVFCPVVSRAGTDIASALEHISSDKPIVVVAMHHRHTAISVPALKTDGRVQFAVNVFFYETVGLLACPQNYEAINGLKSKLYEFSTKKSCINPQ